MNWRRKLNLIPKNKDGLRNIQENDANEIVLEFLKTEIYRSLKSGLEVLTDLGFQATIEPENSDLISSCDDKLCVFVSINHKVESQILFQRQDSLNIDVSITTKTGHKNLGVIAIELEPASPVDLIEFYIEDFIKNLK